MKLERIYADHFFNPLNLVTNYEIFGKKNVSLEIDGIEMDQKVFSDDGLFSKRIFGDMDTEEEYSCECGRTIGKFNEGRVCEVCGVDVHYIGQNIDRFGWIDCSFAKYDENGAKIEDSPLGFHLIKAVAYMFLERVIGRENLKNIIHTKNLINLVGDVDEEEIEKQRLEAGPKGKYWFIGLEEFYDKYSEIIDYYYELNGFKEQEIYEEFKSRESAFTDKIPVISVILRPAMRTADGLKLDEVNVRYQSILKDLTLLKDPTMLPIIRKVTIEGIQAQYELLSEMIINNIKSKGGLIRNQICGTRINFSARNIISPANKENRMDEISVPYQTFLELYKFELINILMSIENLTPKEAELEWYQATLEFSEKLWLIMSKIVKENEVGCLLNRNPTISTGSILYVRIKEVKKDFTDVTLSLSNTLLSLLAGDYDGDVLNLISLKDKSTREIIKNVLSPINLIINPSDGRFNNALNLERDQVLGLNALLR